MRPRLILALCVLLPVLGAHPIQANQNTPGINHTGQTGLIRLHSGYTRGAGCLSLNTHLIATADQGYLRTIDIGSDYDPRILVYSALPSLGIGVSRFLDFSIMLPLHWDHLIDVYTDALGWTHAGGLRGGIGDLEISGKVRITPGARNAAGAISLFAGLSLPTGNKDAGYFPKRAHYISDHSSRADTAELFGLFTSTVAELDLRVLGTRTLGRPGRARSVLLHFNAGARIVPHRDLSEMFLLDLGLEYRPAGWIGLLTELSSETRFSEFAHGLKLGRDPLRVSPGVRLTTPAGVVLTLGGDVNLCPPSATTTYFLNDSHRITITNEPRWRVAISLGWAGFLGVRDSDGDGIPDTRDNCPNQPEDLDGFEDDDGCPEPDNDGDGIPDIHDLCPDKPEDFDGFEDDDGCPDPDNDKDGIPDQRDQCPMIPEDYDGFEDDDGCPEYDNDNDGIPDSLDLCINIPEDIDGFKDDDGCPDHDNDEDGIPDTLDRCPDVKGVIEQQGCPEEKPRARQINRGRVVLRGVNFETGTDILTNDSYAVLEQVLASLREWPEVKIEVRGHTDAGGAREKNRELSRRRALVVRQYLIVRGIDPERITAQGYGGDDPIADNATAQGRAINRRIELFRLD